LAVCNLRLVAKVTCRLFCERSGGATQCENTLLQCLYGKHKCKTNLLRSSVNSNK